MKRFLLATITAAGAWAQTGVIDGPVLGLLPDAHSGTLRPIQGIPGAATFGPSLDGMSVRLGIAGRSHSLVVLQNGTAEVVTAGGVRLLPEPEEGASLIALSPRGNAAAVYSHASNSARIYTGLPDAPKLERTLEISGAPSALAVTDDGQALLTIDEAADEVSLQTAAGAHTLYRASHIGAAEFLPGTMRAAVASSEGVVLVASDLGIEGVSSESDGVAVAASADGVRLVVANRSGAITVHDLRSGLSRSTTCPCSPRTLASLRGNAVFRLNDPGDGPVWLLEADSAEPRVHFVAMPGVER